MITNIIIEDKNKEYNLEEFFYLDKLISFDTEFFKNNNFFRNFIIIFKDEKNNENVFYFIEEDLKFFMFIINDFCFFVFNRRNKSLERKIKLIIKFLKNNFKYLKIFSNAEFNQYLEENFFNNLGFLRCKCCGNYFIPNICFINNTNICLSCGKYIKEGILLN